METCLFCCLLHSVSVRHHVPTARAYCARVISRIDVMRRTCCMLYYVYGCSGVAPIMCTTGERMSQMSRCFVAAAAVAVCCPSRRTQKTCAGAQSICNILCNVCLHVCECVCVVCICMDTLYQEDEETNEREREVKNEKKKKHLTRWQKGCYKIATGGGFAIVNIKLKINDIACGILSGPSALMLLHVLPIVYD